MKRVILLLIATTFSMSALALAGGGSSIGPANPASSKCVSLGGDWLILEDEGQNQFGFCQFGTALIEEWTMYRHLSGEMSLATRAFLNLTENTHLTPGVPNPADQICRFLGGETKRWSGSLGYPTPAPQVLCKFQDDSIIGAWALVRGPQVERQLAAILGSSTR